MAPAKCAGCGKVRVLSEWARHGEQERRGYCAKCIAEDRMLRSERAAGNGGFREGAGAPPKDAELVESRRFQVYMTPADGETVDAWLTANGMPAGNKGVKALLLKIARGEKL